MRKRNKVMGERLSRYMKAPLRLLIKARDLYIKGMSDWSDRVGYGTFMAWPTAHATALPRSFSSSSARFSGTGGADKDLRELIRAASIRSFGNDCDDIGIYSDFPRKQHMINSGKSHHHHHHHHPLPRSSSVGIGRIDEDKPCEFGRDSSMRQPDHQCVFKRSRSYACATRR